MKILIHAINGVGLGHVVRTSRIADALKELRPDVHIVFATNTRYVSFLKKKYKSYRLKKDTRGVVDGKYSYEDYLRYNTKAIQKIIFHERPDVILFDCELNRELLIFCKKNLIKTVYILRNSTSERFSDIKKSLTLFHSIIIPHEKEDVPCDQREFLLRCDAAFTGPILESYNCSENSARKNILITLGSGAGIPENFPLFSAVDSFLRILRKNYSLIDHHRVNVDIVTGPFYEGECDLSGFAVRSTSDSLTRDMSKAKVVVSGAGYNTINEIVSTKTPAVIIPLERRWDDQFQRAAVFEKSGCVKVAHKEILEPIRDILRNWQSYHAKFPHIKSGNRQAAKILSEILDGKKVKVDG